MKYDFSIDMSTDNSHSLILKRIKPGSRVLEFGPATGYMTKYMKEELGCSIWCVEIDRDAAEITKKFCNQMIIADLEEVQWEQELSEQLFDHIIFCDVLEHLRNPWQVLQNAVKFLGKGGTVLTSIPNIGHNAILMELFQGKFDYRLRGLLDDTHLRFFTRKSVEDLLKGSNLCPIEWLSATLPPVFTEFRQSYHSFSKSIQELLLAREDGHVYQFVTISMKNEDVIIEEGNKVMSTQSKQEDRLEAIAFDTSIIILTLNNLNYTKLCIESIIQNTQGDHELIIIDNASTDGTVEYIKNLQTQIPNVILVENITNEGYAYACNQGIALATKEYLVFLNNDVIVPKNWLSNLIEPFSLTKGIGIIGPRSNNCAGLQNVADVHYTLESFNEFAEMWHNENSRKFSEVDSVIGFCMAVRKSVIDVIGGFDTEFGTGNFEDNDFCLRTRLLGYKILIRHDVFVHHFGSKTFIKEKINYQQLMEKNHKIYQGKWEILSNLSDDDKKLASIFVPVIFSDMYNNRIKPFSIEGLTGTSILAVPDWENQASWYELIFKYLQLRQRNQDCCLILRIDPPTEKELNNAIKCLETFLQDMSLEDIPGLIIEATQLMPIHRGSIYTAVDFFVDVPQQRSFHYRRAAEASGCKVIDLNQMEKIFA